MKFIYNPFGNENEMMKVVFATFVRIDFFQIKKKKFYSIFL
jgi:hypothetical protein